MEKNYVYKFKNALKKMYRELAISIALLFIIIVFSAIEPLYLNIGNLIDIIGQSTINGFLAIGITFVIITGGIDLSVGSTMAVSIVCCSLLSVNGINPYIIVISGLLIGFVIGTLNGLLVTKMKLQPFVSTLGANSALRGIAYLISGGWPILNVHKNFRNIFESEIVTGIRVSIFILLGVAFICSIILNRTRLGIYTYAIGNNEEAAKLSGVNTVFYKTLAYSICGMTAAIAGMVMLSRLGTGEPTAGQGYELNAIAAAAIGGASLAGGRGSILGTILGAITLSALKVGLVVVGMDTFYQYIAIGLIIIVAAYFEVIQIKIVSYISKRRRSISR